MYDFDLMLLESLDVYSHNHNRKLNQLFFMFLFSSYFDFILYDIKLLRDHKV